MPSVVGAPATVFSGTWDDAAVIRPGSWASIAPGVGLAVFFGGVVLLVVVQTPIDSQVGIDPAVLVGSAALLGFASLLGPIARFGCLYLTDRRLMYRDSSPGSGEPRASTCGWTGSSHPGRRGCGSTR